MEIRDVNRFLLLTCLLLLTACGDTRPLSSPSKQAERLKAIETETDLVLPSLSEVAEYYEPQSVINRLWVAKVRIPEASYPELKEMILKKEQVNVADNKSGLPESIGWWKPVDIDFKRDYIPSAKDADICVEIVASKDGAERVLYIYGVP